MEISKKDFDPEQYVIDLEKALKVERAAHARARERLSAALRRCELFEGSVRRAYSFVASGGRRELDPQSDPLAHGR